VAGGGFTCIASACGAPGVGRGGNTGPSNGTGGGGNTGPGNGTGGGNGSGAGTDIEMSGGN
jgi:hypothetical protein